MDLREYVKRVYELEKNCYTQKNFIHLLENKLLHLQQSKLISQIDIKSIQKPKRELIGACFGGIVLGAIISIISLIVLWFSGILPIFVLPTLLKIGESLGYDTNKHIILVLLDIGRDFAIIGMVLGGLLSVLKEERSFRNKMNEYNQKVQQSIDYNRETEISNKLALSQLSRKCDILNKNISEAKVNYIQTSRVLNDYYNIGIIFPKYRGLVPITMFFEYLSSGRCSQLEGHEGAYNIYEQELRMNLILNKLDDIIVRLDQIQENQYMLANAIKESNKTAQKIYSVVSNCADQLQDISSNTEATMYFSQVSAMNTTYMAWLKKY